MRIIWVVGLVIGLLPLLLCQAVAVDTALLRGNLPTVQLLATRPASIAGPSVYTEDELAHLRPLTVVNLLEDQLGV
ncbi:MAG: hypothetical protein HC821_01690, partial [Lewinella sp.]|nr:hypothetical protein [Lewinella sp.]